MIEYDPEREDIEIPLPLSTVVFEVPIAAFPPILTVGSAVYQSSQ